MFLGRVAASVLPGTAFDQVMLPSWPQALLRGALGPTAALSCALAMLLEEFNSPMLFCSSAIVFCSLLLVREMLAILTSPPCWRSDAPRGVIVGYASPPTFAP